MIREKFSRFGRVWPAGWLAGSLGLLLACALLGVVLRGHELRPPDLHLHAGRLHLVGFTVHTLHGPLAACVSSPYRCDPLRPRPVYTLWLVDAGPVTILPEAIWNFGRLPLSLDQLLESLST